MKVVAKVSTKQIRIQIAHKDVGVVDMTSLVFYPVDKQCKTFQARNMTETLWGVDWIFVSCFGLMVIVNFTMYGMAFS